MFGYFLMFEVHRMHSLITIYCLPYMSVEEKTIQSILNKTKFLFYIGSWTIDNKQYIEKNAN